MGVSPHRLQLTHPSQPADPVGWPFAIPRYCIDKRFIERTSYCVVDGTAAQEIIPITIYVLFPSPDLLRLIGAPQDVQTIVAIHEDYSSWPKHESLEVMKFGAPVDSPVPGHQTAQLTRQDGTTITLIMFYKAARKRGAGIFGYTRYFPDGALNGIEGFTMFTRKDKRDVLKDAWDALHESEAITKSAGGSPRGPRKAREWDRRRILEWYSEASDAYARDNSMPELKDLAGAMEASDDTASRRLQKARLQWPPTQEQLDELEAE